MRKQTTHLFILFHLVILFSQSLSAQELNETEMYSKAKMYFYQAYNDTGELSSKAKIDLYLKADTLFRKIESWNFSIVTILESCRLLQTERAYKKIDQLSNDAIHITNTYLKKESPYYSAAFNLKGGILVEKKKDFSNAIPLFKKAAEIDQGNGRALSYIYYNIGNCYQELGDYDIAIEQYQRALMIQIDSLNTDITLTPKVYNKLGFCYGKKDQLDLAIEHYELGLKSAKIFQPNIRDIDQIILYLYQNLADLYLILNQYEPAKKYIDIALAFQEDQDFIKDNYTYQIQGELFLRENKYEDALKAFRNSTVLAQLEFKDSERHPDIGMTYFRTANACLTQNEADSSLIYYQRALINNSVDFTSENWTKNPSIEQMVNTFNAIDIFEGKAKAFLKKYKNNSDKSDLENAFENYALAVQSISKTRQSFNAEGSKYTLAEKAIAIYEGAIETTFLLYQKTKDTRWLEMGFQFTEGNKAATLLEGIKNNEAMKTTGIPDSLLAREYYLQVEMAFYEKLIHEENQKKSAAISLKQISIYKNILFDLKEDYQKLIDGLEVDYPEYYALKYKPNIVELKNIQQRLKNTALVEFFVGQKYVFIFTITEKNVYCDQIVKGENFEKDIQTLRNIIVTPPTSKTVMNSLDKFVSIAHKQYNKFLKPVCTQVQDHTQHLIIVPDDLLAYVPFSLLLNQGSSNAFNSYKNLPYLFKEYEISYNYSTALWLEHLDKKERLAEKEFIGFAPEFSAYTEADKLSPLSCNIKEVTKISKSFGAENLRLKAAATVDDFKSNVGKYQIIHLATHTTLDLQNSAFNRIYFSDTYLNQNDLYQLDLNAELSVLSSCNTGAGELKKGEGVMSLSRGFIHAGCPSILMSLWSVDDCATADIMLAYYEGLKGGESKGLALQQAKSKYLKQTSDIMQAHPYYWAAFVQYGNTDSMYFGTASWMKYLLGGVVVLLLTLVLFFRKKGA